MRSESKRRGLPTLAKEVKNGKYNFKHPLQRPSGQWNALQKTELIDSVLREYLIDPVTIVVSMVDETTGDVIKLNNAVIRSPFSATRTILRICSPIASKIA